MLDPEVPKGLANPIFFYRVLLISLRRLNGTEVSLAEEI